MLEIIRCTKAWRFGDLPVSNKRGTSTLLSLEVAQHSAENYTTSLAPGTPIESIEAGQEFLEELTDEYFTVLELNPYAFEVVQLRREGHIRANFEKTSDNDWKGSFLVP